MIDRLIRTDVRPVDKRAEVREVYAYLLGEADTVPVVVDGDRPYGVVNERALVKSHLSHREKLDRRAVTGTRVLSPRSRAVDALDVLAESKLRYAPVVDGERLVGVVDAVDLLGEVESALTASELALEVPVLDEGSTVGHALHAFHALPVAHLPFADAEGKLVGVVHRSDAIRMEMDQRPDGRAYAGGEPVSRIEAPVSGLVDHDAPRVKPGAPYAEVVERLRRFGYAIVVGEGERPVGVVTPEETAYRVARER